MGYILPITQHTYIHYHARMLEDEKSPHYISATSKVIFNKIQRDGYTLHKNFNNENEELETNDKEIKSSHHHVTQYSRKHSYLIDKQIKAVLTGKGTWMNEQV